MKLIIQIPCFNEASTLPVTIADLPTSIPGVDRIELLVIDDGSSDGTAETASSVGVDHVVRLKRHTGLAHAFAAGLEEALSRGADVIVNTDGDNQYRGSGIAKLISPLLHGEADIVVGNRGVQDIKRFSRTKKLLQRMGSWVVRWASATDVPDATSGFRAFSREAALRLNIFSTYTYTLETLIQAGRMGLEVVSIPVETNEELRESRLISSIPQYVFRSIATILRIFLMYEPLRVFLSLGTILVLVGGLLIARFGYFYLQGQGQGHVQSLIIAAILVVLGFQTFLLGLLADLVARNRRLQEEARYRIRKLDLASSPDEVGHEADPILRASRVPR